MSVCCIELETHGRRLILLIFHEFTDRFGNAITMTSVEKGEESPFKIPEIKIESESDAKTKDAPVSPEAKSPEVKTESSPGPKGSLEEESKSRKDSEPQSGEDGERSGRRRSSNNRNGMRRNNKSELNYFGIQVHESSLY